LRLFRGRRVKASRGGDLGVKETQIAESSYEIDDEEGAMHHT